MSRYHLSLSVTQGDVAEYHTRRTYSPPSAEPSLSDRNVHVYDPRHKDGSLVTYREQFNAIFADAIERYNAKQKRARLQKGDDYYEEITSSKRKEKPIYSTVVQLGNRDTCGVTDTSFDAKHWRALKATDPDAAAAYVAEHLDPRPQQKAAKECLIDICQQFETWFPNLKVVASVIHDDEVDGTCHATVDWVPIGGGEGSGVYRGGLDTRCALNKALEQMGYDGHGYSFRIKHWQADFKAKCEEVMAQHDIEREYMNNEEKHRDVATWRMEQERKEEADKLREIKRMTEIARVNMTEFEVKAKDSEQRLKDLEYQIAEADMKYRAAYAKAVDAERELKSINDKADAAESRIRMAESRVQEAQNREDDARRAYRRIEDDTVREQKRLDDLKREAEEQKRRVEELSEWIKKLSDIRQMLILFVKALLGYLEHKETDKNLSMTDRQSAGIAKRLITKLQNDFINVASRAAKKSLEQILSGRHIYDDVTVTQQADIPTSQEMNPSESSSGGGQEWWGEYDSNFFLAK